MLNEQDNFRTSTPLVRGRSVVQSHAAAPETPTKSTYFSPTEKYIASFGDATERERAPSNGAESVRDVHEAFETWADQQILSPDIARRVQHVLGYLLMSEREGKLPGPMLRALAEHVEAIRGAHDTCLAGH